MQKILPIIKAAIKEDIGKGDITSRLIIPSEKRIKALILAKQKGLVCGLNTARLVFQAVDKTIRFRPLLRDGKAVKAGQIIARIEGRARDILAAERVALNFLSRMSGIATLTNRYVQRVKACPVKIMDTRKTTPGLRLLEKYAVRCGGGFNHRLGLWDGILVKDNHITVYSLQFTVYSLRQLVKTIKANRPKKMKIEVEVKNLNQFRQALEAGCDIIMLDNFSINDIKKAVKTRYAIRNTQYAIPKLEVSGGVNLQNVRRIATYGVELISVGALTHSAPALDIALNCE